MLKEKQYLPIRLFRFFGIIDGISLLILLGIAMPLKYWAGLPLAVTFVGSIHGAIFIGYIVTIVIVQLTVRWNVYWSLLGIAAAFIPFANFLLDRAVKKREAQFRTKAFPVLWLVYAIIFFSFMDLFAQLPIMSTFATSLGASTLVAGMAVGIYSFSNTGGNLLAGLFTDRLGPYRLLVIGLLGTSIMLFAYTWATTPESLLVIRFVHGFIGGFIVPAAFTYVANQSLEGKTGSENAMTGAFVGSAAIIGPAFSGIMAAQISAPFVFQTVGLFGVILFVAAFFLLRGQLFRRTKDHPETLRFHPALVVAFGGAFLMMFSQGALAYLLPLRVEELGFSSRVSGTLLSTFGVTAVMIFLSPIRKLFDQWPALANFRIGVMLIAAAQLSLGLASSLAAFYGILIVYGVGFAFTFPAINVFLYVGTTEKNRGKAYGYFYAFFSLGVVLGSSGLSLVSSSLSVLFMVTATVLLIGALCSGLLVNYKSHSTSR
ncbi:MFS transporter [Chryseomicrobium palamuruense]|uniref:MFS transporter n=1 Tax=Chryseomicrobium palamuruense TaxID=682973 RepID=A0ABV8URI6_9BACL